MAINQKDQKILWGKAACRCSMPECKKKLVLECSAKDNQKNILYGENCHIVAERKDGPRGDSQLLTQERNQYPNLILLCCNHHEIIDKDIVNWPIEKLHQIKSNHELWVETQLTEVEEDLETKIYSDLINLITEGLELSKWDWLGDHAIRFILHKEFVDGVDTICYQIHKRIWPNKYLDLENAIINLGKHIEKYVTKFLEKAKLRDEDFFVEDKWWKEKWRSDYHQYLEESENWKTECFKLFSNIVVALNEFSRSVRKHLNPNYFLYEGKFIINDSMGVLNEMKPSIYIPEEYEDV